MSYKESALLLLKMQASKGSCNNPPVVWQYGFAGACTYGWHG